MCVFTHNVCVHTECLRSHMFYALSRPEVYHYCIFMCVCVCVCMYVCQSLSESRIGSAYLQYGVATVSRIDKITGLFCNGALYKRRYSAKETYNFIDPTDRSHPIADPISDLEISIAKDMSETLPMGWLWLVGSIKL